MPLCFFLVLRGEFILGQPLPYRAEAASPNFPDSSIIVVLLIGGKVPEMLEERSADSTRILGIPELVSTIAKYFSPVRELH